MKKLLVLFAIILGCISVGIGQEPSRKGSAEQQIKAVLDYTALGWNTGDLSKYLYAYVPGAKEMTGQGPKGGVEHIEQTMKNGFWKTGRPIQQLRYQHLEITMIGKDGALVTGQYILSGADRPDRTGWFTTVWIKSKQGWRMIHDHS